MKTLLFTGIVAAATVSTNASAAITPGDTLVLSRTGGTGYSTQYIYDSSASWNTALSGSGSVSISSWMTFSVAAGGTLNAFCVEVNEGFPDDPITYTATTIDNVPEESPPGALSSVAQTLIKDLYARYYDSMVENASGSFLDKAAQYTAFQLLIWEFSHENFGTTDATVALSRADLTTGAFGMTSFGATAVQTHISTMLAGMGTSGFMGYDKLLGLTNPNNQDLLIVVPSPAIAGLAGLGLVGMRRRRR